MLKKAEEEKKQQMLDAAFASAPYLPQDCVSCILVRLPIDSLQRSRCVCKLWYDMIPRPVIIYSHARRSETVVLFQTLGKKDNATTFSVEACLVGPNHFFDRPDMKPWSKLYLHYMEITDGEEAVIRDFNVSCLGKIMASCNGLILLENKLKKGGLILMNPVTQKAVSLPVGTISLPHRESYSLVLDHSTTKYKVVHLFSDESGYTSCETMEVGARLWKMVNGPSCGLISWFGYKPVSAIGALHWLPHIDHNDYIVSMETGKESFTTIQLPESGKTCDRILEMGGFLCFCTYKGSDELHIWVLKAISDIAWTRLHCVPIYCVHIWFLLYQGMVDRSLSSVTKMVLYMFMISI